MALLGYGVNALERRSSNREALAGTVPKVLSKVEATSLRYDDPIPEECDFPESVLCQSRI